MINLFLAALWLVMAAVAFLWPQLSPGAPPPTIWDTGLSWGWAFLALTVYNLVRWQLLRAAQVKGEAARRAAAQLRAQEKKRPSVEQTPDPNFDFSEGPPPRPPGPPPNEA